MTTSTFIGKLQPPLTAKEPQLLSQPPPTAPKPLLTIQSLPLLPKPSRSHQVPSSAPLKPRIDSKAAVLEPTAQQSPTPATTQETPPTAQQTPPTAQQTPPTAQQTPPTAQQTPPTAQQTPPTTQQTLSTTQQSSLTTQQSPPAATLMPNQQDEKKDPLPSLKPIEDSMSPEYITMKEMLADFADLLTGNAPIISQLNNHLFSTDLIPKAVHVTVETTGLTPYDRANKIFSSVLATLECHPNPNSVFSSLITSLQKVGLKNMASKLMEKLSKIQ